ncbi:Mitochondrial folate transporter/carrier [Ceratobasidium theobromae]|uniref:Mitochondrial folate transporter/carrier n=1 Tax=Ceratobasidium theobromae TaxID=1582974 RepID=A0A5N5QFF0_9AGAM|nr:Mitochondrial folate transporter/carrier [Ceratobasidium theobromae]
MTPPSFFPTPAIDNAVAGLGAGTAAVLCIHPLDLLRIRLQVATSKPVSKNPLVTIWSSLTKIKAEHGVRGLYRGVGTNLVGNATSWAGYFWIYAMIKSKMFNSPDPRAPAHPITNLIAASQASAITALLSNPIWVVKVRMFTTHSGQPDGLSSIYRNEGWRGLYVGTTLALLNVSSGTIQFVAYEELRRLCFQQKRRRLGLDERTNSRSEDDRLSNTTYTIISAAAKLIAMASTYPLQVIRSRMQNHATAHLYPTIPTSIARTWKGEGVRGFYRGMATSLVRALPNTCVTFVVYENLSWLLRRGAVIRSGGESGHDHGAISQS